MFNCPYCKSPEISKLRKAILSPGLQLSCRACGKPSGIQYASWLMAMIPGSIFMLTALLVSSKSLEWALNIVGIMLMIAVPFLFTPLIRENRPVVQDKE